MALKKALFLALVALPQAYSCSDSSTFTFGQYSYNNAFTTRDCAWILKNNVATRKAKYCTSLYGATKVQDECPVACDACPAPSQSPSARPSTPPTVRATLPCVDSPLRLKIETVDKVKPYISRYCNWVLLKDVKNRCALPGVSAACPVACNKCTTCVDPGEKVRFKFAYNGKEIVRNCDFVGRVASKTYGRCQASGNICRSTCGAC